MINIGSGGKPLMGFKNLDYPNDEYKEWQKKYDFIPYDIRNDVIPFEDNSVDGIYCSHVIEHIENEYISKMFSECFRVLKENGILRLSCPDAEFLYQVSKYSNEYWDWRYDVIKSYFPVGFSKEKIRSVDYLVREIATPKLEKYIRSNFQIDYFDNFKNFDMYDFFEYLTSDLAFDLKIAHINYWTFEKIKKMLVANGFFHVIHSKWSAACNREMQDITQCDTTAPILSLYVDAIK
jgi:predicted SAM-dependent methyltransferase